MISDVERTLKPEKKKTKFEYSTYKNWIKII